MKTPKPNKVSPQDKFSGPKLGKVKKSGTNVPKKKFSALTNIKNTDQALDIIKNSKDNVSIKINKKKDKIKLPNESPKQNMLSNSPVSKKKSPKSKKKNNVVLNGTASVEKEAPKKKILPSNPVDPENNSSPVKTNVENKKVKLPFKLDDSLNILTPQKSKKNKDKSPKTNSSPEVLLGIQLEKALSPKSEKKKKKAQSKQEIQNKDILNEAVDGASKKEDKIKKKKQLLKEKAELKDQIDASSKIVGASQSQEKEAKKKHKLESKISANDTTVEASSQEKSGKKKRRRRKLKKKQEVTEYADFSLFEDVNAKNALKALLKTTKSNQKGEKDLLGEDKFIFLQINLLKGSDKTKSVLHVVLPHMILPDSPEICLITPDLKGKRNDPDEAIDFYQDLLRKKGIDYVSEIIPIRKLKKEYTSFEHRMKLSNRLDAVLVEGKVSKLARIGRRFARTKKCVSAVKLDKENLKAEFDKALRRVVMFSNGRGLSFSIKCGRVGMSVNDIAENILTIGKRLAADKVIIGDYKNVASVFVKTALSKSFPIYVSLTNPNEVAVPEGKKRKIEEPIEDEISTVLDAKVIVHPTGNVRVKKLKTDSETRQDLSKQKNEPKAEGKKKKNKKDLIQSAGSSDEEDSDLDSGSDEDLDLKLLASSKIDSEDDDDDSDYEDYDEEESSYSEINASELDDSDDGSDVEDQIVAAENEYLKEVRQMQDSIAKKKRDIAKAAPNKPDQNLVKKAQPEKNEKQNIPKSSGSTESQSSKQNKKKKQESKLDLNKPANQQKKTVNEQSRQKKFDKLNNEPQGKKQNKKMPANNKPPTPEKANKLGLPIAKKGKFEKSGGAKKGAVGMKPFQGGKKFKSN